MQLAVVAVLVLTLKVVNAVGYVACLLYLSHKATGTNGVYAAGWNKEYVALVHLVACQRIRNRIVLNHLLVLLRRNLLFQSVVQLCTWGTLKGIPHLGFAACLTLSVGNLIGRVYLYAQVLTGIYKLNQQGKLVAKALVVLLAHQLAFQLAYQLVQALAFVLTLAYDGLVVLYTRNLPALAYILQGVV